MAAGIEAAAAGVAGAIYGASNAVVMGVSAARLHGCCHELSRRQSSPYPTSIGRSTSLIATLSFDSFSVTPSSWTLSWCPHRWGGIGDHTGTNCARPGQAHEPW